MRRCLIGDLMAAADCIAGSAGRDQARLLARLLSEAHAAHRYARRFGRPHPLWGDGSLMARALAETPAETRANSPGHPRGPLDLAALAAVAGGLLRFHQERQPPRRLADPPEPC